MLLPTLCVASTAVALASSDFSFASEGWQTLAAQREPFVFGPDRRYSSCLVAHGSRLIATHGYFYDHFHGGGPMWLSDMWNFDLASLRWTQLHAGGASAPHGRMSHTCVLRGDSLFLFGGDDGGHLVPEAQSHVPGYLNDLWRFDLVSHTWNAVATRGVSEDRVPSARAHHAAVVTAAGTMLVFGGIRTGDLWELDLSALIWKKLRGDAQPGESLTHPGKRHGCGYAFHDATESLYLFGGYKFEDDVIDANEGFGPLQDLWVYDRRRNVYALLKSSHPKGGRTYGSLVLLPHGESTSLVLFAGAHCHGRCICHGDVSAWSLASAPHQGRWVPVDGLVEPITRYKQSALVHHGALYTFGGESYQPYMYHNSLQALGLTGPANPHTLGWLRGLALCVLLVVALVALAWASRRRTTSAKSI